MSSHDGRYMEKETPPSNSPAARHPRPVTGHEENAGSRPALPRGHGGSPPPYNDACRLATNNFPLFLLTVTSHNHAGLRHTNAQTCIMYTCRLQWCKPLSACQA